MKVAIAGGFDPLHIGHIKHIEAASKLGDWLIVIVSTDRDMIRKKGYEFMPFEERIEIVKALKWVDEVVPSIDADGTVAKTLKVIKPDIFAKGGDRTEDNMPENEIQACKEIGCKIVYGVGEQMQSSSGLVARIVKQNAATDRSKANES
ncbi:Bifunctional protein HldE [subsurface metagenome]